MWVAWGHTRLATSQSFLFFNNNNNNSEKFSEPSAKATETVELRVYWMNGYVNIFVSIQQCCLQPKLSWRCNGDVLQALYNSTVVKCAQNWVGVNDGSRTQLSRWLFCNYHAASMQSGLSHEKNVCPSVKCVDCEKKERNILRNFYTYIRSFHLVFLTRRMVGGGRGRQPLQPKILGQTDRIGAKTLIFSQYSLIAPQP